MTEIQASSNLSWIEVQFMKKAVDILNDVRIFGPMVCWGLEPDAEGSVEARSSGPMVLLSTCRRTMPRKYLNRIRAIWRWQWRIFPSWSVWILQTDCVVMRMLTPSESAQIEKPIDAESISELRTEVQNRSNFVKSRHETMLLDSAEGLQEDRWKYTV